MGNLYNMINGVNPATFIILPMLGWNDRSLYTSRRQQ